jgi:hypothetical protein
MRLTRNIFAGLVAVCILLILSEWATAQPASAASEPAAPYTLNTACGAAGTGYRMIYVPGEGRRSKSPPITLEAQNAKPGQLAKRIDGRGEIVACYMPRAPLVCAPRTVESFGAGGRCKPMSDPPGQPHTLPAARLGKREGILDQTWRGRQEWECRTMADGPRWVPIDGYCSR